MILAYVDESFDDERFDLGALLITPTAAKTLAEALSEVADKAIPPPTRSVGPLELHGHDIFHAKGDWRHIKPMVHARVGTYRRIVELVSKHADGIVVRSVRSSEDRTASTNPPPRSQVAWRLLLDDIEDHARAHGDIALVIADDIPRDERRRREFAVHQQDSTIGDFSRLNDSALLDTVYFATSRKSRLIQAIDCVLFMLHRKWTVTTGSLRQLSEVDALCRTILASGRVSTLGNVP